MENYFNYFTEIEEQFQRRRGGILLLSTLDWALIETWKDAGIPLEAVLRGIDAAFDRYEQRPTNAQGQQPGLLCAGGAGCRGRDEGGGGGRCRAATSQSAKPAGFQTGDIVAFLRRNADLLLTAKLPERPGISGLAAGARDSRHPA